MSDDEVSTVLRHFRPKPEFLSNNRDREWTTRPSYSRSGASGGRGKRSGHEKHHRRCDRGFSSVQFVAPTAEEEGGGRIRLAYLHVHNVHGDGGSVSVFLSFEIETSAKSIECTQCSAPDECILLLSSSSLSATIKSTLDQKCNELSSRRCPPQASPSSESLFSLTSRLLQFLNNEFPTSSVFAQLSSAAAASSKSKGETFDAMIRRSIAASKSVPQSKTQKRQRTSSMAISNMHNLLDAQTLLMRCAAAGRNRSKICAPVPVEFTTRQSSGMGINANEDGDNALSHLVFDATNQLYMLGFRGNQMAEEQRQQQQQQTEASGTLLSFLLSLPWTEESSLTRETMAGTPSSETDASSNAGANPPSRNSSKAASNKHKVARLALNINASLGDPSPEFANRATNHGTLAAYHGTKIESAWSILNYGLRNLSFSEDGLAQNGAMMGAGVYLSSSKRVAEAFAIKAAERPPKGLASAFVHESLVQLLIAGGVDVESFLDCSLDGYDVVCLPVFEAVIIKPPLEDDVDDRNGTVDGMADGTQSAGMTRQEGKYFVCSDSEFVRITKLHLTIELRKKSDVWERLVLSRYSLGVIVLIVAMLWAMG